MTPKVYKQYMMTVFSVNGSMHPYKTSLLLDIFCQTFAKILCCVVMRVLMERPVKFMINWFIIYNACMTYLVYI